MSSNSVNSNNNHNSNIGDMNSAGGGNLWGRLGGPAAVDLPPDDSAAPLTKQSVRQRVWEFMERHDVAAFPRPVYGRIPNFRGAAEAAARLSEAAAPEFAAAKTVEVGPDKPQEEVRFIALSSLAVAVLLLHRKSM